MSNLGWVYRRYRYRYRHRYRHRYRYRYRHRYKLPRHRLKVEQSWFEQRQMGGGCLTLYTRELVNLLQMLLLLSIQC